MEEEYDLTKVEHPELIDFMNDLIELDKKIKRDGVLDVSVDGMKKDFDTYFGGRNNLD